MVQLPSLFNSNFTTETFREGEARDAGPQQLRGFGGEIIATGAPPLPNVRRYFGGSPSSNITFSDRDWQWSPQPSM